MSTVRKGSKVSYPIGRGRGYGTVIEINGDMAKLTTEGGKTLSRAVESLAPATPKAGKPKSEDE